MKMLRIVTKLETDFGKEIFMISGVNSQDSSMLQAMQGRKQPPSADEMFGKLTNDLGGDGQTITKDQLDSYIEKLESSDSGNEDKGKLGFLKQLQSNWDKVSGGSDGITAENLKTGMDYLKPPSKGEGGGGAPPSASNVFSDLLKNIDSDDDEISKSELEEYLEKLQENGDDNSKEAKLVSNMINNFDSISGGADSITASAFQSSFNSLFSQGTTNSRYNWQDPSTITSDQLQSPIDIRV